ncbi:hypothetical protein GCM10009827_064330 [Dactylosporangium maewongense]|uniref:Uncharacterized protein n=1 Tax=Dactylosporangium maewongense TaxID=634393 RepID=A0ABP4M462_9ACTN
MRRRHPYIGDDEIRSVFPCGVEQRLGVTDGGRDRVAEPFEQAGEPLPQQHRVVGEHDLHAGRP